MNRRRCPSLHTEGSTMGKGIEPAPPLKLARIDATTGPTPVDAATGATPGVAAACRDLGMSALDDVVNEYGILPPGQA